METPFDPRRVKAALIRDTMLALAGAVPSGKPIGPDAVARAIGGKDEKVWRLLMPAVRREAARLAKEGKIVILRKGSVVDPDRIRGLWRLRLRQEGEALPVFEDVVADDEFLDDDED